MTQLFTMLLDWLTAMADKIPVFDLGASAMTSVSAAISTVTDFLNAVNYIVPLPDIAIIIGIDVGIRVFKISVFAVNWIIRRIVDAIP